ncbi:MAG: hypothetical protein ACOCV1_03105 [Bacillota bacterium]
MFSEELWDKLSEVYGEKQRYYHTMNHIINLYNLISKNPLGFNYSERDKYLLQIAAFYHDIVYDMRDSRSANEINSARVFLDYAKDFNLNSKEVKKISDIIIKSIPVCSVKPDSLEYYFRTYDIFGLREGFNPVIAGDIEKQLEKEGQFVPYSKYRNDKYLFLDKLSPFYGKEIEPAISFLKDFLDLRHPNIAALNIQMNDRVEILDILRDAEKYFDKVVLLSSEEDYNQLKELFRYHEVISYNDLLNILRTGDYTYIQKDSLDDYLDDKMILDKCEIDCVYFPMRVSSSDFGDKLNSITTSDIYGLKHTGNFII